MPLAEYGSTQRCITLSKVIQKQKNKYHISLIGGILKHGTNELIYETETHMHRVQTYGGEERRRAWGTDWEFRTRDVNYYRMDKQQHRIVQHR